MRPLSASAPKEGDMVFGFFTNGDQHSLQIFFSVYQDLQDFTPGRRNRIF
jgi:hypothetical protein